MSEPQRDSFQISQGYDVVAPSPGKAYPILCSEWLYLKDKVKQISDPVDLYHTVGSACVGAALSTFITILSGGVQASAPTSEDTAQTAGIGLVVAWACFAVTGFCGFVCIFFAFEKRKVTHLRSADVVAHMDVIEQRFIEAGVEPLGPPNRRQPTSPQAGQAPVAGGSGR
ncbi:MAG: hypothetical protein GC172_05610 [Phycisphaera sp.]|nr:hypothetical protein [Phycisphaera sp.]